MGVGSTFCFFAAGVKAKLSVAFLLPARTFPAGDFSAGVLSAGVFSAGGFSAGVFSTAGVLGSFAFCFLAAGVTTAFSWTFSGAFRLAADFLAEVAAGVFLAGVLSAA